MTILPGDTKTKDPDAIVSAAFDWSDYLGVGISIGSKSVGVTGPDAALVVSGVGLSADARSVIYQLSGGTVGATYRVTCHVVTTDAPPITDDRSLKVKIRNL